MIGNYDTNATVELAVWLNDPDPEEQYICNLEECYFEPSTGDVVLTFEDRDSEKFFDVSMSVKAVSEWNEFVDGLPRIEE